jgi:hypothetical protein
MFADAKAGDVAPAALPNFERACADSHRVGIVEDDDLIVRRQPKIAFDSRAFFERRSEGDQAVLGKRGARVQAAMRKSGRTGFERIRP